MTEKLKCPFCGHELVAYPYAQNGVLYDVCRNPKCKYDGWHFPTEIWTYIIAGKKELDGKHAVWQTLSKYRTPSPEDYIKNIGQKRVSFITPNMYLLCAKEAKIIKDLRETIKKDK